MTAHWTSDAITLHGGDCLHVLRTLADNSVDAIVTDPPYGLEFMGKEWDGANGFRRSLNPADADRDSAFGRASRTSPEYRAGVTFQLWCQAWAVECLRVLKPGGHLLAFGGTRTYHRLTCGIEDAGFEVRDSISWLYGTGFPKSLDVSKAIDKAAGAVREVVGTKRLDAPATDDARTWAGWGTALKPAHEPIVVARKPFVGTVAANVLLHGTGALNIDATRVATTDTLTGSGTPPLQYGGANARPFHADATPRGVTQNDLGRWPANVLLDGDTADALDVESGVSRDGVATKRNLPDSKARTQRGDDVTYRGEGGASRFFPTFRYQAKAPSKERPKVDGIAHPTVKPVALMRWLVRLVTPPGGVVLDPFAGTGTTAEAALAEGMTCILIEREPTYLPLIIARLTA